MNFLKKHLNKILNIAGVVATGAVSVATGGLSLPSILTGVAFVVGKLARSGINHDELQAGAKAD